MLNIIGRRFENTVSGFYDDTGYWQVTVVLKELITEDMENWMEESVAAKCIDRDFDTAQKGALRSVLQYLEGEVYAKGFKSLVESKLHEKGLLTDGAKSNDNQNTTSESSGS